MDNRSWLLPALLIGIVVFAVACVCLTSTGLVGFALWANLTSPDSGNLFSIAIPTNTPEVIRPTVESSPPGVLEKPVLEVTSETAKTLENTVVPVNDRRELARRLEGKEDIPLTMEPPTGILSLGTHQDFWVTNVDTSEYFQVSASLRYITDHVYFWVQDEVSYDEDDLQKLAETFETKIYPTDRAFFGSEWTPGVDGDPHLYILYAEGSGSHLLGYFSSSDENHPLAHEYSNAHEMFLLSEDNVGLAEETAYGVLAHEFQHMIHWYQDRNETSWLNEGFSELAAFLNEYEVGSEYSYIRDPDIQLNDWPNDHHKTLPHYGASFLFLTYFLDRFGEDLTRAVVSDPANDLESIDQVLNRNNTIDPVTGRAIKADDVFMDWVIASYLKDERMSDGRYTYHNYSEAPRADVTETVRRCPQGTQTRDVSQYGVDYIRITCLGNNTFHFEGSTQAKVVPIDPHSGAYAFWSNKGDESDMILTQTFDFSNQAGPLTFTYWTWYDIEEDYDYVFVEASTDGENWQILTTPSGTPEDPSGNSYGWGYNGSSDGWIQEKVDLSAYAGQKVQIRFEYVTDAAVNGEGMLLDDITIPEIGYATDFERNTGGWEAEGWARIQNVLPQEFRLALITKGESPSVTQIEVGSDSSVDVPLKIGKEVEEVVIVVSGMTRNTRQKAAYRFELSP